MGGDVAGMGASGEATYWDRTSPVLDEPAVLRARLQLGALLFGLSVPLFALVDLHLSPDRLPWLWTAKAAGLVLTIALLWQVRAARSRRALIACALIGCIIAAVVSAVSGVITGDPLTTPLVCVAMALATATALPWGVRSQTAMGTAMLAIVVVHAALLGDPIGYPTLAAAITVIGSMYVAHALDHERRQVRAELRDGEERFRVTFDQAAVGIAHVSLDGRWLRVNRQLSEILGRPPEDLLHKTFQDITHPDDLDTDLEHVRELLAGERTSYTMEKRYVRRDGSLVWANLSGSLVRDAAGAPRYFIAVVEDISERKQAEARIRTLNAELQARSQALEDANRELEAFGYSVSHDLRSPLRTIEGFTRIVLEDHGVTLDADARQHVERVAAAAGRMHQLIDDLLLLAQISRRDMHRRPVDVSALAEAVAGELRASQPDRQTVIAVAPGITADADPNLLRVALDNLLGNAWKYTARRQPGHVAVDVETRNGSAALVVRDDGAGFDMAHKERLFRPFQRLHSNADFEGTGIGLAIVERIVRRHGGEIDAEAAPDGGATFTLTLGPGAVVRMN